MAVRLGLDVVWLEGDWRHGADPERIADALDDDVRAVMVVHNETSTGVTSRGSLTCAPRWATTTRCCSWTRSRRCASIDYRHDEWGVDVTVGGSQKGLMLPAGLSFNAISEKALAASKDAKLPRSYWDWTPIVAANEAGYWPYTSATNLLYGLREALQILLREEGLDAVFARHIRHAAATRAAVHGWGLEVLALDEREFSGALTAVIARRLRRDPPRDPRALRHVARRRAGQAQGPGVPDRPPRRLQRPDARGHAGRRPDGPAARRPRRRRRRRARRSRASSRRSSELALDGPARCVSSSAR